MTDQSWLDDPKCLALLIYSSIITLVCIILSIQISELKCVRGRKCYSQVKNKPEDLQHLNRKSVDNKYEIDSPPRSTRSLPIPPNKHKSEREYDSTIFTSKSVIETENPPIVHHYEEMKPSTSMNPKYESILETVVTTLSAIHDNTSKDEDVYETFMRQLMTKIKLKDPGLYQSIYGGGSSHTYEKIEEDRQSIVNTQQDSGDENSYATFISSVNGKKYQNVKMSKNLSKNGNVFGSTDHLKFLKESRSVKFESDDPYLEAKRFSAKPDCPEPLRQLCYDQVENTSGSEVLTNSPTKPVKLDSEYKVPPKIIQATPLVHETVSRSNSRHSHEFEQTMKELEKVISTMAPQERTLKLSKQLSQNDILL